MLSYFKYCIESVYFEASNNVLVYYKFTCEFYTQNFKLKLQTFSFYVAIFNNKYLT